MSDAKRPAIPAASRLTYAEFLDARLGLREAGVPPRVASALANAGVTSLADLRSRKWNGPDGLREQLSLTRHVGRSTLNEIDKWRLADPAAGQAKPRPVVTWEGRAPESRTGGRR